MTEHHSGPIGPVASTGPGDATGAPAPVTATACEDGDVASIERDRTWDPPSGARRGVEPGTGSTPPPPATGPPRPPRNAHADAGSVADGDESDRSVDRLRERAEWWYRPVVEAETWIAVGYLFVGAVVGPLFFAATAATLAIAGVFSLLVIGVLLTIPAFAVVRRLSTVERRRAGWVGGEIPPRALKPVGDRIWSPITTRLSDPARWRQVAYLVTMLVAGPLFFTVGVLPWALAIPAITGASLTDGSIIALLVAIVLLGAGPRVSRFAAGVHASFAAWFLGPDPNTALEERVVELSSQREQILDAVSNERRRIERNLHDGVQQQLVALGIDIGRASSRLDDDPDGAKQLLADAREKVRGSIGELRMIGRGLHPAVLSDRGLDAALSSIVAGAPIPVAVAITTTRDLSTDTAETAYYVVNEAVANVLKHSGARAASVRVDDEAGVLPALRITVHDDGCGGATLERGGSGLAGIAARVGGVDGVFDLSSPPGGPTEVVVVLPIRRRRNRPCDDEPTDLNAAMS